MCKNKTNVLHFNLTYSYSTHLHFFSLSIDYLHLICSYETIILKLISTRNVHFYILFMFDKNLCSDLFRQPGPVIFTPCLLQTFWAYRGMIHAQYSIV